MQFQTVRRLSRALSARLSEFKPKHITPTRWLVLLVGFSLLLQLTGLAHAGPATAARQEITSSDSSGSEPVPMASEPDQVQHRASSGSGNGFIENHGQFESRVQFQMATQDGYLIVTEDALWVVSNQTVPADTVGLQSEGPAPESTPSPDGADAMEAAPRERVRLAHVKIQFPNNQAPLTLEPFDPVETNIAYIKGNDPEKWVADAAIWRGVRIHDLAPGYVLELREAGGSWDWNLVEVDQLGLQGVAPDRSPSDGRAPNLQLSLSGADSLSVADGRIRAEVGGERLELDLPSVVSEDRSSSRLPEARLDGDELTLDLAPPDPGESGGILRDLPRLVADALQSGHSSGQLLSLAPQGRLAPPAESFPLYSLLVGGGYDERAYAIVVHPTSGEHYVTGRSQGFPILGDNGGPVRLGDQDIYILRLTPQGEVVAKTFIGGAADDFALDMTVLENGNLVLLGRTDSDDFSTTPDGFQRARQGLVDVFVIVLPPSMVGLEYGTYFGGTGFDYAYGLVTDPSRPTQVYFTGMTTSDAASFPLRNPIDGVHDGGQDAYLAQLDLSKSGSAGLEFSTYLGGTDADQGHDVALGQDGILYLTGQTLSDDLFGNLNPDRFFDPSYNGGWDSFLMGVDPAGRDVVYGSYLGGAANDCEQAGDFRECRVVIAPTGLVYLAGMTFSDPFPTTTGVYQRGNRGERDIYVTAIDPERVGSAGLVRSTLIGGPGDDLAFGLAVSGAGEPVVVGRTTAEGLELTEERAIRTTFAGGHEAFAHVLSSDFSRLLYGTYIGGDSPDGATPVLIDASGNLHVGGFTFSSDFFVTHGDDEIDGISDAYVVGIDPGVQLGPRMPVIVMPGVPGAQLIVDPESDGIDWSAPDGHGGIYENFYAPGEEVWVSIDDIFLPIIPGTDDYFDVLRLEPDGKHPQAPELIVGDVFETFPLEPIGGFAGLDFYAGLMEALESAGYTRGQNLFTFPYDWRLDIASHSDSLDTQINEALTAFNGTDDPAQWSVNKVVLIGHSNGAALARAYVSEPDRAARVDRLIALGAPYLGTPKFLKLLLFGDPLQCILSVGEPPRPTFRTLCPLNQDEVKDIVQNMPNGFQVGPGPDYWLFYDNSSSDLLVPFSERRDIDGDGIAQGAIEDYEELKALLFRVDQDPHLDWDGSGRDINQTVWELGEEFHRQLDLSWEDGIPVPNVDLIVGTGRCTLGQIETTWKLGSPIGDFSILEPSYRPRYVAGDGTVPLFSATLHDPDRGLDFRGGANTYFVDREFSTHAALATQEPVQQLIINLLQGNENLPDGVTDDISTVSRECRGIASFDFSPVEVQMVEDAGRVTGFVDDPEFGELIEQSIPGSSYDEVGETKAIYVPEDGVYSHVFRATDPGSLNLIIRDNSEAGPPRTISYLRVPLTESTVGEVVLDSRSDEIPVMKLDHDGDGVFDEELLPTAVLQGEASGDVDAPVVQIESPADGARVEGRVHMAWTVVDEGAGLLQEIAELDPETARARPAENDSHVYLLPGDHLLRVIAEDRLGNVTLETSNFTVAGPCELPRLTEFLDQVWEDDLIFHPGTYRELKARLEVAQRMTERGRHDQAVRLLEQFLDRLEVGLDKERVDPVAAALLEDGAKCILGEFALQPRSGDGDDGRP
ncbi:MAG: hypothetical protein R3191_02930 [Anaerolineales bacterium]|nr:hypothetical protein [Anaerolineales bacterium]